MARASGVIVEAFCPNPGRLEEMLLPGSSLILEEASGGARKTRYTLVACRYRGHVIPLDSTRANRIAAELILPRLFPSRTIRPEVTLGRSRFDFAVDDPGGRLEAIVEVKACTLVEHGVAMFPDAPSERARRHVTELAERPGGESHVLFVIMNPDAQRFVPNFHTDPAYCAVLLESAPHLHIHAVSVRAEESGDVELVDPEVPVDLDVARRNLTGGGTYLLILGLDSRRVVDAGALGALDLPAGFYVYVGSAMGGLDTRIARHLRRTKSKHWHIDYLTAIADTMHAMPVMSVRRLECALAEEVGHLAESRVAGFGCSDCRCPSHLFRFPRNPMGVESFISLVYRFRHRDALG